MVKPVLETCKPRPEILAGTFNPEVFTASLGPIIDYYRSGKGIIDSIYTSAENFFREATYPTQGLRLTLAEVFGRIAGDMTVPAIHRLETAFGGGKTHTLIACTHIAYKGKELGGIIRDILDPKLLPDPGSVSVVGVAGDEIPVHKPKGNDLVPYTLWGEIAWQIGGEVLYREIEDDANSHAAPGRTYFNKVFNNRKVIIMLDELAQYAARLEAARPDGASQLAAFLMALHGYARNHPGIAIVLTLASATDAFARQTERLPVHGLDNVEMVAYAVACQGPGGSSEVRLIRSWSNLNNLQLAEAVALTEAEIGPLRGQLERMARDDLEPCLVANRIERGNIRAAHAHEMLNYLVARGLFESNPLFTADGSLFGPVKRQVESLYEDRDQVNLPDLPADVLNLIKEDLLFECHVPVVGDKARKYVPYILAQTALNAANRMVESMKVKKSEHRMNRVLARLQREIEAKRGLIG